MQENNIILIPSTPVNYTIGSIFNNFFVISNTTELMEENDVAWDFSNVSFLHPFLSSTLALYKSASQKHIECINLRNNIQAYLDDISFKTLYNASSENAIEYLKSFNIKSYIPISHFKADDDNIQQHLQEIIQVQSNADKLTTPLSYILGELICNIIQHAESDQVFLFSQYLKEENTINMCIADKGIGIYSSYVRTGKYLSEIGDNDAEALKMANDGYSTKNLPEAENRGFGISTSKKMLVKGLRGCFYMMSGNAFMMSTPYNEDIYLELPKNIEWQGTIFLLRIPIEVRPGFKYTDYIE